MNKVISEKAIAEIKKNNPLIGKLMGAFNKGQATIENWLNKKDIRLTTPLAVEIISEGTGLSDTEILEETEIEATGNAA